MQSPMLQFSVSRRVGQKYDVFDCDGVLVDSNALKVEALRNTLLSLGSPNEFISWAAEEFRVNFGRTRTDHFDAFLQYETVGGYRMDSLCVDSAIEHYGKQVEVLYLSCPVIEETVAYLSLNVPCGNSFVVSASSQVELRAVLPVRVPVFSDERIFGGPVKKVKNLQEIAVEFGVGDMVFYGDAVQDAKAAMEVGVLFVGLAKFSADPQGLKRFCLDNGLVCFDSCSEITS